MNSPGPLHTLLTHVTARINTLTEQRGDPIPGEGKENTELGRIQNNLAKWISWQDALEDVLFPPEPEETITVK